MKRIIAIILAVVFCLSIVSQASAVFTDGPDPIGASEEEKEKEQELTDE